MKFVIEETDEIIGGTTGLFVVNNILNSINFKENVNDRNKIKVQSKKIPNADVFMTYIGILAQGKTEFERAEEYREHEFFKTELEIKNSPSCSILRQRFNAIADTEIDNMKKLIDETNRDLLKHKQVELTPCYEKYIPLDIDVTPMDNSDTKKEGVSWTYKEFEGYAPIMAYIGKEGYLMRTELREGKANGQCAKTPQFLKDTIKLAEEVTDKKILARTDCGHDCCENVLIFTENEIDFVMKAKNTTADKPEFYFNKAEKLYKQNEAKEVKCREGKERYLYSYDKTYLCTKEDGTKENITTRIVVDAIKRTSKANGQILVIPEYECKRYTTSLREATEEEIIEIYHAHGTSEQFHSEIKSDMDVERLPSGKFKTNELVLGLVSIVFNVLRMIGQIGSKLEVSKKRAVERKRIKTVIKDMILFASKLVKHARKKIIKIYKKEPRISFIQRNLLCYMFIKTKEKKKWQAVIRYCYLSSLCKHYIPKITNFAIEKFES